MENLEYILLTVFSATWYIPFLKETILEAQTPSMAERRNCDLHQLMLHEDKLEHNASEYSSIINTIWRDESIGQRKVGRKVMMSALKMKIKGGCSVLVTKIKCKHLINIFHLINIRELFQTIDVSTITAIRHSQKPRKLKMFVNLVPHEHNND